MATLSVPFSIDDHLAGVELLPRGRSTVRSGLPRPGGWCSGSGALRSLRTVPFREGRMLKLRHKAAFTTCIYKMFSFYPTKVHERRCTRFLPLWQFLLCEMRFSSRYIRAIYSPILHTRRMVGQSRRVLYFALLASSRSVVVICSITIALAHNLEMLLMDHGPSSNSFNLKHVSRSISS